MALAIFPRRQWNIECLRESYIYFNSLKGILKRKVPQCLGLFIQRLKYLQIPELIWRRIPDLGAFKGFKQVRAFHHVLQATIFDPNIEVFHVV